MLRAQVPETKELQVGVEQVSGTLHVVQESAPDPYDPRAPSVVVLHANAHESFGSLVTWALSSGVKAESPERRMIPFVEPGEYKACWVFAAEAPGLDFGVLPPGRCAGGLLNPNGELTLKLPPAPGGG